MEKRHRDGEKGDNATGGGGGAPATHHLHAVTRPVVADGGQGFEEGEHLRLGVRPAAHQEANLHPPLEDRLPEPVVDGRPKPFFLG